MATIGYQAILGGIKKSTLQQAAKPKKPYSSPRYDQKIYGKVAVGEKVSVYYDNEKHSGTVFYIHPKRRFFSIVTEDGLRESFYFSAI